MYLTSLSINGFKSFAKKSELSFDAPITAIVGPNGSGKSNVAESFRFALGEQSVKSMRGRKGEDLIWGGSESVARGNRAAVEIVLNNESRIFQLDFDEIRIERTVHRDGQNEYSINDSKVRLRDIQELLSAANVGPSGHHIISQGEADRILTASAKDRREMIEEALGLKSYQYKKQEAEKKLGKTRENMTQVESLRREHAPHLKYLEKQIKQIEKSLEVQQQLNDVYAAYLRREDIYIAHHHDRLNQERLAPASRLEALIEELDEIKKTVTRGEDVRESQVVTAAKTEVEEVRTKRLRVIQELGQLEGQMRLLERRLSPRDTETDAPKLIPRDDVEKVLKSCEHDVEKLASETDASALHDALKRLAERLRTLVTSTKAVELPTKKADEKELESIAGQYEKLAKEVEKLEAEEAKRTAILRDAEAAIRAEATEQQAAERRMFELMNERRELETTLRDIDREIAVLDRDRQEFKRELQEAVVLIGSGASRYFEYQIVENDTVVTNEVIVGEAREVQRERRRELEKLKIRLEELGVGSTEAVQQEYKNAKERDEFLAKELADLDSSINNLTDLIAELTEQFEVQFTEGVEKINVEFNKFFILMFGGGSAKLEQKTVEAADADDEEGEKRIKEYGIELSVQLPNKRVRGLDMLSGGERALSSIALIFAMSQVNPPPFIILDETDAALDEANSRRYGDMIEALAKKSQLILITHNRETMSRAQVLYGVTMGIDGVSKLLSVKFDEALAVAK